MPVQADGQARHQDVVTCHSCVCLALAEISRCLFRREKTLRILLFADVSCGGGHILCSLGVLGEGGCGGGKWCLGLLWEILCAT